MASSSVDRKRKRHRYSNRSPYHHRVRDDYNYDDRIRRKARQNLHRSRSHSYTRHQRDPDSLDRYHRDIQYHRNNDRTGYNRSGHYTRRQHRQSDHRSRGCSPTCSEHKGENGGQVKINDDEEGHLVYHKGDWLKSRYQILDTLGTGTFGKVALCYDKQGHNKIALKIIRNVQKYRDAAELEIRVLKKICKWDPKAEIPCVRMLDWFDYYGHTCISFNVLGSSSFDFMKDNHYSPYPMRHIQNMGYQLLCAISFLHDNNLTHTDLKPENILFNDSSYNSEYNEELEKKQKILHSSDVCVIDFGSAVFKSEYHSRIVSTRHYRAPEVILELGWSYPCDIWSVGCILYEYYTGNALFQTHDNREHLAMMEIMLGDIPIDMQNAGKKSHYFTDGKVVWDNTGEGAKYVYRECKPFAEYARNDDTATRELFDLMSGMLCYDPKKRTTAREALQDNFFKRKIDTVNKSSGRSCSRSDSL